MLVLDLCTLAKYYIQYIHGREAFIYHLIVYASCMYANKVQKFNKTGRGNGRQNINIFHTHTKANASNFV